MSIQSSHYALEPLHAGAYQLHVAYFDPKGNALSKKSLIFTQEHPAVVGEVLDVHSQNGTCAKDLFKKKDVKILRWAAAKQAEEKHQGPALMTLDLTDPKGSYLNGAIIHRNEQMVCDFLGSKEAPEEVPSRAKEVHHIFHTTLPLDFVFCEGSLKHALLHHNLSEDEADYWLKDPIPFCQYAEIFMNAFKLGQTTPGIVPEPFFKPLAGRTSFSPQTTSTVWYPPLYEKVYALDGLFFQKMRPIFDLSGTRDGPISSVSVRPKI